MPLKQEILSAFEKRGFKQVPVKFKKHFYLLNRGDDKRSNFFVFAKIKDKTANFMFLDVKETGYGKVEYLPFPKYSLRDILDTVSFASMAKPSNYYFVHLHGHMRSFAKKRIIDDGLAPYEQVLLDMAFHHIDLDLSGPHNNILLDKIDAMRDFLKPFHIEKGYGLELTFNVGNLIDGFHVLLWFPTEAIAADFSADLLKLTPFNKIYAPLPPKTRGEDVLLWLNDYREVAVGLPHPFYGTKIFGRFHATGILHYMNKSKFLVNALMERANAVAILNADAHNSKVFLTSTWMDSFVRSLLQKVKALSMIAYREADLDLLAAYEWKEMGKTLFFEADSHINPLPTIIDRSPLGYGWNAVVSQKRPSHTDVLTGIHDNKLITSLTTFPTKVIERPSPTAILKLRFNLMQARMLTSAYLKWKLKPELANTVIER